MSEDKTPQGDTPQYPTIGDDVLERLRDGLGGGAQKEYYGEANYVFVVRATFPTELWSGVFYSWLSMKGHLQGLHDVERVELLASGGKEGTVEALIDVVWSHPEPLEEWLTHGYAVDEMLLSMGVKEEDMEVELMRDFA